MPSSMNWTDGLGGATPVSAANLGKLMVTADAATAGTPTGDALRAAYGLVIAATVTASGALVVGKHNPVDATSGALTMTLPTGVVEGASIGVEKLDASTNAVTVTGNVRGSSGQTISLPWAHETLVLRADSTGSWWPVSGHKTKAALDAAYQRKTFLDVQDYGVAGNGTTDDTAALNTALSASASTGLELRCRPDHTYLVSRAGTKSFTNNSGTPITGKGYCVQVPSGAKVDFRGAKLKYVPAATDDVVLSNTNSASTGDVVAVRNVTVDGGGRADAVRGIPMVWFVGIDSSVLDGIALQNCSYTAGQVSAATRSRFDNLTCNAIRGQGWILGGNTAAALFDCQFGTLTAWDVDTYGGFNQPGNGFCIGGQRLKIQRIIGRNCAAGHKYMPGCIDVHTDYAEFDGAVLYGESALGSANSGTKVQGDAPIATGTAIANGTTGLTSVTGTGWAVGQWIFGPQIPSGTTITAVGAGTLTVSATIPTGTGLVVAGYASPPPERVSFSKVVSRNCTGNGLYIYYCGDVRISDYYGYKNARNGTSFDVDTQTFTTLEIASLRIDWAGFTAINIGSSSTRYQFDQCAIYNPGDVTTTSVNGIVPGGAEGHIGLLTIMDDRKAPINFQGIAQTSTDPLFVREYRCFSTSAPIRLQNSRSFVGNPLISSGTDALVGTVTLTAAATTTTISNSNIRSVSYNSGWVEPVVELVPMNASAQALGLPRYSVPSTSSLKLWHNSAAGTEVFSFRILGYTWRTPQLA